MATGVTTGLATMWKRTSVNTQHFDDHRECHVSRSSTLQLEDSTLEKTVGFPNSATLRCICSGGKENITRQQIYIHRERVYIKNTVVCNTLEV